MGDKQTLQFNVGGYTGRDTFFSMIYSYKRMAKRIARKSMRVGAPFAESRPDDGTIMLINMPDACYRIIDDNGNVEVYDGKVLTTAGV